MASRRSLNQTDESTHSVGSETRRDAAVAQQYLAATELSSMQTTDVIQRSLTIKSVISTASSFARRSQAAVGRPDLQQMIQIGAGFQAAVFEQVGTHMAFKKEHPGNSQLRTNLEHEYSIHRAVAAAFGQYDNTIKSGVHVPQVFDLVRTTDNVFWEQHFTKFPGQYRTRGAVVRMERILPLPKVVRKALISYFYPQDSPSEETLAAVLNDTPNKHCLARTYLGRANGTFTRETFSLRNFPLYLSPMEELGLDVEGLATSMGKAFAIMHWGAGVNGDDVEFVLGTSAVDGEDQTFDFQHRAIGFYLLDFGQCDLVDFSEDADVVYQAFKGAMVTGDNQLFIPHYQKSGQLFSAFKAGYMSAGRSILVKKELQHKFDMEEFMAEYEEYAEDFL